ncbi:GAF domain-containing protein [Marininema mesophilum]|uniref:GAF domain-containing protein n=1 Tax=Marininema mesophilum TaxID=1048340 RepID=A0A1H2WDR8_9BACL|nr:LuxR C-terminal-related transcriptional regulator [Marininema mesophilum]SDW78685.1 GAF domain-containing protein [Marininema mesophilum]
MQFPTLLDIPMLSRKEMQTIIDAVSRGYSDILVHWNIKLATLSIDNKEKSIVNEMFLTLINNLNLLPDNRNGYSDKFLRLVKKNHTTLQPRFVTFTLGVFEEILTGLLPRTTTEDWTGFRWIHSLVFSLLTSLLNITHPDNETPSKNKITTTYPNSIINKTRSMLESIVKFDTLLLGAHSLEDVMRLTVHHLVEAIGYKRSALFWYSPITRTVEGTHSHQVDITELRRVRAFESNIPGIPWLIRQHRPLYVQDVSLHLPNHYIKQFRLQSLLIATLHVDQHQPVGFLLLDRDGDSFVSTTEEMDLLEQLSTRACIALRPKLYDYTSLSTHPPASPVLTHREQEILQMIAYGYSTRHIGETLHISEHTVAEHAQGTLKKLNSKNRPEAVAKGIRLGLIR